MSVNKYALTRYHVLDRCFANRGRRYYINDLLAECNAKLAEVHLESEGIKVRQLYDDIAFMESPEGYDAPIERYPDGKRKYHRYSVADYSIHHRPLSKPEVDQIKAALDIISRFKGMPQFEWINEFSFKLEQAFTIDKEVKPIIGFDSNDYLKGIHWIGELFHAILNKQVLTIGYRSFKVEQQQQFLLHPYFLKQYNNRWFLFGWNAYLDKLTNLALDRMETVAIADQAYRENTVDFDEYFEDIVGVSRYEDVELVRIEIEVSVGAAPYLLSKPLHGSQKTVQRAPRLIISIEVIPNPELESLLLSFGERIVVRHPESLRARLNERLTATLKSYQL